MNTLNFDDNCKRKLDETYLIVYVIENTINMKKGDFISKSNICSLIGVDLKGYKQLLNIYEDKVNNNRYWLDCFENLKSRGIKNILFLSVGDNKNMKRAAKIAFPDIVFVDSITYIVNKFQRYTTEKSSRNTAAKIHNLYVQKTLKDYEIVQKNFNTIYNNSIHKKLIEKYLCNIQSIYKYSQNIRNLLFKHSSNMAFYDKIRITFNNNNKYISELKEIYDQLGDINKYFGFTPFTKKEWTMILNDLILTYPNVEFI